MLQILRKVSTQPIHKHTASSASKLYNNLFPWKTPNDVVETLENNIIHEDDDYIAFNKPSGLPMHSEKYTETSVHVDPTSADLSVNSAVPVIEKIHGKKLHLVYSQNRLNSGVIAFAKSDKTLEFCKKYFKDAKINKKKHQKYLAVTIGVPKPIEDMSVYLVKKEVRDTTVPVMVTKPSNRMRQQRGRTMSALLNLEVLKANYTITPNIALVQIHTSSTKWDLLPIYMVESLSPILGEQQYASRLKTIQNNPILAGQEAVGTNDMPYCESILPQLGVKKYTKIPLHLHCLEVCLPGILRRKSKIIVKAPLPDFFKNSLKYLNLNILTDDGLVK